MHFKGAGLGSRQSEQQGRGLFIGSRLRSGQSNVPGDQASFKLCKCFIPGVGGQCLLARLQGVAHQFGDTG